MHAQGMQQSIFYFAFTDASSNDSQWHEVEILGESG